MLITNERATRSAYPSELQSVMSIAKAEESRDWISAWDSLNPGPTPLYELNGLARSLGIGKLYLKDESVRSDLGSFKALGAPIALARLILRLWPNHNLDPKLLFKGGYRSLLEAFTVISATDGNHGKGLAAAAQTMGCRCVIVLHANVSEEREQAIAVYGAQIVRTKGNYDQSVEEAAHLATTNGWQVVSDTSYEGYEDIPRDVMQGYSAIAAEIVEQTGAQPSQSGAFTHVFLQGGVGGMAAGLVSYLWEYQGEHRPSFIVVEPAQADCLLQSAIQGRAAKATGSVDSVMAGLACGETSPLAWKFLERSVDHFMTIEDGQAVEAMRILANGDDKDVPIVAGESGTAGLAALQVLRSNPDLSAQVGLDAKSCVLIINTEGATAPRVYADLVGESAESVQKRQAAWAGR
ncbi:diaminopropionate ammonia-lyase [Variovorax sp. LjRoot175]|uniref:diaminopropionate ammonia-lyase n=1 Tax=Variovorax sp. LjRoot175 TaxID=3342276 RepID=UPI003ECCC890